MSKYSILRWSMLPMATMAVVALCAVAAPGGEAARLDCVSQPDGTNFFALSLQGPPAAATNPREVVVLISTAASQVGQYRAKSLAAVQATLADLDPADRVKLMAYDLNAVSLTKGFVAPNSPEIAEAIATLNQRVPLGSTDMEKALTAAVKSYRGDSTAGRAIICVGEGSSRANMLGTEQFEKLVGALVAERTPVIGFGVGPRIDRSMLTALAGRTGGMVVEDIPDAPAADFGIRLASAVRGQVYWPTAAAKWPEGVEMFPKTIPPLRSDRDTVVVGASKGKLPASLDLPIEGAGAQKLNIAIPAAKPDEHNGYLVSVVDQARVDGGVSLPLADSGSLNAAKREIDAGGRNLDQLAQQALASGNLASADQLIEEALRRDPRDARALAMKAALAKSRAGGAVPPPPAAGGKGPEPAAAAAGAPAAGGANDLNLVGALPPAGAPVGDGALAAAAGERGDVMAQALQAEVQNSVNQARAQMGTNPENAQQNLRLELEKVRQVPDLKPEIRDQLVGILMAALREGKSRQTELEHRRQRIQETDAANKERELVNESLQRSQQKLKQLMDRFDSLMLEGRYKLAEESAGAEAAKLAASTVPSAGSMSMAAMHSARFKGNVEDILAVRVQRIKGFADTLFQTEKSSVPFADDPPIVYPDPEVWKELTARRKDKFSASELSKRGPAEKKIEDALKSPTTLEFVETPLDQVIDFLKDLHKIEIQLDKKALDDAGKAPDQILVTKNLKGISLRSALKLLLDEQQLKYVIHNEVLLVTSPDRADSEEFLTTKVYPVADLVVPIQTPALSGMGGMGGSMGGGMGSMMGGSSGGMGGGGMGGMMGGGGMGGGMGGMMGGGGMGGGGGGGFFNVPREPIPNNQADGMRAFFVKEEAVPANEVRPASVKPATTIDLTIADGADVNAAWEKYFAAHQPDGAAVRQTVRNLMSEQKFKQVEALIEAALRHQQVQPWMYEALALAMQAAERPKEEIERAIMSAAEFAQNSADLMYLGLYLTQMGLDQRALQIFRQVSKMEPLWPEPLMHGMKVANRLKDVEGLQWTTAGILSQAWPVSQSEVWRDAHRIAMATLEDLRAKKRTQEADRFEAALNAALARDCIVKVSWTGDADVDVMVKEPTDSVCSLRNWRTTSGAVLQGDSPTASSSANSHGHSAIYVCPRAFSGNYELLVRRVWGELTTGKVTVEVITHYGTPQAKRESKKIALPKGEALVKFALADGRRTEPLRAQQVANAAATQVALNKHQQVLAQQMGALVDPAAAQQLALARQAAAARANDSLGGNRGFFPYPLRSAVGYAPVIITLPEGTNMAATAVVSADRRYVRITCVPLFSHIADVHTFSYESGGTTTETGGIGTGGTGGSGLGGGGNN